MTRPLSAEAVRELDRRAIREIGIPGVVLMENAGAGAARIALEMLSPTPTGPVLVLAGPGNNGGDGYVLARHLAIAGVSVHVLLFTPQDKITGDARTFLDVLRKLHIPVSSPVIPHDLPSLAPTFSEATLLVDALLGTGTRGEVRSPVREVIELINHSRRPVLALDLPSGLNADTGEVLGVAVRADVTATFLCPKIGFSKASGPHLVGRVVVVDIGITPGLLSCDTESRT